MSSEMKSFPGLLASGNWLQWEAEKQIIWIHTRCVLVFISVLSLRIGGRGEGRIVLLTGLALCVMNGAVTHTDRFVFNTCGFTIRSASSDKLGAFLFWWSPYHFISGCLRQIRSLRGVPRPLHTDCRSSGSKKWDAKLTDLFKFLYFNPSLSDRGFCGNCGLEFLPLQTNLRALDSEMCPDYKWTAPEWRWDSSEMQRVDPRPNNSIGSGQQNQNMSNKCKIEQLYYIHKVDTLYKLTATMMI